MAAVCDTIHLHGEEIYTSPPTYWVKVYYIRTLHIYIYIYIHTYIHHTFSVFVHAYIT